MQNLQCDWLLSVHYNTTMHAARWFFLFCLLFPVSRETVTTFSVVFMHKLYYNVEKNGVKMKEKK